ncbi:endoribonuclease L-PSP [Devosia soli]|uniref:Endoribonuclease L-PSP n=1 Tax=Devosia soli TaxID=361041 RepID=A0A0F5LG26_9HYPH|nr:RidA family protein [Devosia soli]KKB81144.1 endoribonuclease L-PSP [Devosia soli]
MTTTITRINPASLPDASRAGYSQISVVEPGRLAFVSGQVAWRADGGAAPGSLAEQVEIVAQNLTAALAELKATPHDIAQMRIYVVGLNDESMGIGMAAIGKFLQGAQPSLTGIGVSALAAPGLLIEVEMVVRVD